MNSTNDFGLNTKARRTFTRLRSQSGLYAIKARESVLDLPRLQAGAALRRRYCSSENRRVGESTRRKPRCNCRLICVATDPLYQVGFEIQIKRLQLSRNVAASIFVTVMRRLVRTITANGLNRCNVLIAIRMGARFVTVLVVRVAIMCGFAVCRNQLHMLGQLHMLSTTVAPGGVRMMPAASQHRVSGEREKRQSVNELDKHCQITIRGILSSRALFLSPTIGSMAIELETGGRKPLVYCWLNVRPRKLSSPLLSVTGSKAPVSR